MKLVVAVDNNWGIGKNGDLLARVKNDLRYFRDLTKGKTVVLGSTTLATFPNGQPLKNRTNIVLSRRENYNPEGAVMARSLHQLGEILKDYDKDDVVVIGGASVYDQLLRYCDTAYITKFKKTFEADTFFPNLDESEDWILVSESEPMLTDPETDSEKDMEYTFCEYKRIVTPVTF